jgi:hypothetical protein
MTLDKLMEYGHMLVQEQENVKRVQLADKYLCEAALGDANEDAIKTGSFYGKAAQQGCTVLGSTVTGIARNREHERMNKTHTRDRF